MAEEIVKTIEGVDKLFSQIVVNGESHESTRFVNNTQTERNNSTRQSNQRSLQGEDVYGVNLNDTLHNFVDRTVAEALDEEASSRQYADQQLQSSIDVINAMIPSGTSGDNQLTNASDVERDIASAIEALDVPATGGNAKYIKTISEVDGKISTETGDISDTVEPSNSNPVTSQAVASACAYCASSNTTVTGASLYTGATLKVLFTAQIAGADTSSALIITYNGTPYAVKTAKDGSLIDFTAKASGNDFVYCQAYTTLELMFDGTNFIIIGNPVVISNSDYTVYADGKIAQRLSYTYNEAVNGLYSKQFNLNQLFNSNFKQSVYGLKVTIVSNIYNSTSIYVYEAIMMYLYPSYELGIQEIIPNSDITVDITDNILTISDNGPKTILNIRIDLI